MSSALEKQTLQHYVFAALLLLVLYLISLTMSGELRDLYLKEGGLIEWASAAGYVVCAVLMLRWSGRVRAWPYVALMLLFMMRELDFDKRFTEMGILKSKFLVSSAVPLHQKIIGLLIILFVLYVLYTIVRRDARFFLQALRNRAVDAWGWAAAMGLIFVSKSLDGLGRKMADIGVTIEPWVDRQASTVEEILELGIPIFIFLACRLYFKRSGAPASALGAGGRAP